MRFGRMSAPQGTNEVRRVLVADELQGIGDALQQIFLIDSAHGGRPLRRSVDRDVGFRGDLAPLVDLGGGVLAERVGRVKRLRQQLDAQPRHLFWVHALSASDFRYA